MLQRIVQLHLHFISHTITSKSNLKACINFRTSSKLSHKSLQCSRKVSDRATSLEGMRTKTVLWSSIWSSIKELHQLFHRQVFLNSNSKGEIKRWIISNICFAVPGSNSFRTSRTSSLEQATWLIGLLCDSPKHCHIPNCLTSFRAEFSSNFLNRANILPTTIDLHARHLRITQANGLLSTTCC